MLLTRITVIINGVETNNEKLATMIYYYYYYYYYYYQQSFNSTSMVSFQVSTSINLKKSQLFISSPIRIGWRPDCRLNLMAIVVHQRLTQTSPGQHSFLHEGWKWLWIILVINVALEIPELRVWLLEDMPKWNRKWANMLLEPWKQEDLIEWWFKHPRSWSFSRLIMRNCESTSTNWGLMGLQWDYNGISWGTKQWIPASRNVTIFDH